MKQKELKQKNIEERIENIKNKLKFFPGGIWLKQTDKPLKEDEFTELITKALTEQKQEIIKEVEWMKTKTEMNPTTATGVAIMERLHERNKLLEEITTKLKNI